MKCVDCNEEVEEVKQEVQLNVKLDNQGHLNEIGNVFLCNSCNTHYADEKEALRLMDAFEKQRLLKDNQ